MGLRLSTHTQIMNFIEGLDKTVTVVLMNSTLVKYMRSPIGKAHLIKAFKADKTTRIANQISKRDPVLVMRAYFDSESFCEMMLPYSVNKDLLPTADPYINPTAEAFRQFRLEAKL